MYCATCGEENYVEQKVQIPLQLAYRAVESGTVGKIAGGTKLLSYYHRGSKEQRLSHAHHTASCVVERQRSVEHVIVPETQCVVYASGNEEVSTIRQGEGKEREKREKRL